MSDPTASDSYSPRAANAALNLDGFLFALAPAVTLLFTDHLGMVGGVNVATAVLLSLFLFVCPDRIANRANVGWWENTTVWTLLLLTATAVVGPLLSYAHAWAPGLCLVFLLLIFGFPGNTRRWSFSGWLPTTGLLLTVAFLYFGLYGKGYHHWLFTEAAALGKGVLDTYYHAAISESILHLGVPSSSIDGSPFLRYHWLSHVLFGRLAATIGVNSFSFYHLFYPALFVPLGVKFLYHFGRGFTSRQTTMRLPLVFAVATFAFYALPLSPLTGLQPFIGESQLLALLIVFAHALFLKNFADRTVKSGADWVVVLLGSFLFGALLSFTKISTGFVWLGALAPLFLLHVPPRKWWWSLPPFLLLPVLIVLFVLVTSRSGADVSLTERMRNVLGNGGQLVFLAWVPLLLLVVQPALRLPEGWGWSRLRAAATPATAPALVLLAVWVLGAIGALAGSSWPPDVMYFVLPGVFLSFPLWLGLTERLLARYNGYWRKAVGVFVIVATLVSSPQIVGGFVLAKEDAASKQPDERTDLRRQFLRELYALSQENNENMYVAIPTGEAWFWSAGPHELASPLLVPAVSGRPMVAGISQELYESGYRYYSVATYKNPRMPVADPAELLPDLRAAAAGAKLVVFKARDGKIVRELTE